MSGNLIKFLRILITGTLFSLFGVICMVGNLIFYPVILFNLQRFEFIRRGCRVLIRYAWSIFLFCTKALGYQSSNSELLKTLGKSGQIIICNHPSLLDVVFFLGKIKNANCIVKGELARNIFLWPAIKAAGYIPNSENEELLERGINALKQGQSLVIFPEGSRTKDEIIFHKAASYIAIKGAKSLSPVFLHMNPRSLKKGQKWYQTPLVRIRYEFKIADSIELDNFHPNRASPIRSRLLHEELKKIYEKEFKDGQ